ncbi:hypothetical protein ACN38_g2451 [Penicillium nordicum]|uniref:Uncharacterized protein n=1 Tax=Penicillium nordicum TaxID=229535 RepID=A0A0M9WIX7_9EURO|nr:hypothetical protein ACN38_g2451 [Penicillium nordicum]
MHIKKNKRILLFQIDFQLFELQLFPSSHVFFLCFHVLIICLSNILDSPWCFEARNSQGLPCRHNHNPLTTLSRPSSFIFPGKLPIGLLPHNGRQRPVYPTPRGVDV